MQPFLSVLSAISEAVDDVVKLNVGTEFLLAARIGVNY